MPSRIISGGQTFISSWMLALQVKVVKVALFVGMLRDSTKPRNVCPPKITRYSIANVIGRALL